VQALEYNFVKPEAWLADVEGLRCGGRIAIPQGPGIGFEPDAAVMRRYRRA
jgi:L-alanine-DL-glutamate epimerase-like enolase superfamily enzyme